MEVTIVGGGIGGLTLALMLHEAGIATRVYEAAPELKALGVGVNLLPHADARDGRARARAGAGARSRSRRANRPSTTATASSSTASRPAATLATNGRSSRSTAATCTQVLLQAFRERVGADRLHLGWRCIGFRGSKAASVVLRRSDDRPSARAVRAAVAVGCDGIHSSDPQAALSRTRDRRATPGINMWRGVTRAKPFLTGASMVRIGWLNPRKVLIYPIRDAIDAEGRQLINWVVDIETPQYKSQRDWNRPGGWRISCLRSTTGTSTGSTCRRCPRPPTWCSSIRWSTRTRCRAGRFGRLTLLGDAAHPMYPRGANGAASRSSIAARSTDCLKRRPRSAAALEGVRGCAGCRRPRRWC